jgi:triphosphoribosyl-dephospho-CoA synthase
LLCAAAGSAPALSAQDSLGALVQRRWGAQIGAPSRQQCTHGADAWRRYGVGGARREAADGFPHLYQTAWPALQAGRQLADGDEEAARVHCLFSLMASLEDTNLLHRGGVQGLLYARSLAGAFMRQGGVGQDGWRERAVQAHRCMTVRRLSPGGSADLLAMTLFVDAIDARRVLNHQSHVRKVLRV